MPREFSRARRVAQTIKRAIAPVVSDYARGENMGMLTVTDVKVSPDLSHAIIFVSSMTTAGDADAIISLLNQHVRKFRSHVAMSCNLRLTPSITFRFDEALEQGARIAELLRSLQADPASRS